MRCVPRSLRQVSRKGARVPSQLTAVAARGPGAWQPRIVKRSFSLYDFFTIAAQATSFLMAASFLFWFGTNCATCALHWSIVRPVVDESGAVPVAQAVTLMARREMQDRENNDFMELTF